MRRTSRTLFLLSLALAATLPAAKSWGAVTEDNFQLRNTADLVALCTASQSDPFGTAAVNFCQGFSVGVTRVLQEEDAANARKRPMFCLPAGGANRNQALAAFVSWASADPARMNMPATDGLAAFLAAQYPCAR